MKLTYIQQSGSPPVDDGGDQYTGLDRFGRVIDQRWMKDSSGADLERVEYEFDRASNRVWRNNTVADALSAKQDEFYTYDGLNQLLTLQRGTLNSGKTGINGTPTWEEDFTFDPTGNWDNYVNQVNGTTTLNQPRTHNAVNEVETISGSSALIQQNAAGNLSKVPKPLDWSSAYTMTYDAWQRLVKVKNGGTTTAIYAYDGQNRRVTKVTGSTTRHYYYSSQWQILEEQLNSTTTADRQFVWGLMALDNLILRDRGTERFYSLQDVFSCTAIADTTGTVQERYGYNAFGLSRVMDADFNVISTSSCDWETRYDCYRFDAESSFYQVRFRYLHPTLGRWLTRDPIEWMVCNLYIAFNNSPIVYIDPDGRKPTAPGPKPPGAACLAKCFLESIGNWYTSFWNRAFLCGKIREWCVRDGGLPTPSDIAEDLKDLGAPDKAQVTKFVECLAGCVGAPSSNTDFKTSFAGSGTIKCDNECRTVVYDLGLTITITVFGNTYKQKPFKDSGHCKPAYPECCSG